ncbi:CocE/NonD family hydrolase, partial [Saliphagus sp. LR7]|uniref:CocE/NonD family hydrolase n=1 Tax=Saliphagus sp. LR7 TaxID=2282654 RepID=UPI000DF8655A
MGTEPAPSAQATYGVTVHQDLLVEARDGTQLATDTYRPSDPDTGEPIDAVRPALLARTPYDKHSRSRADRARWFAQRGYVVVVQDVRGRYGSEGTFFPFVNEPEDGYDTVEWVADRPYCDGQVATTGTSYGAWVQSALATLDPPSLAAMFVNQGAANGWEATLRHNGAFEMRWLTWALTLGSSHRSWFLTRFLEKNDRDQRNGFSESNKDGGLTSVRAPSP